MESSWSLWFGQVAVLAFFSIAFLQSAADKWLDSEGNLAFLKEHFSKSPLASTVEQMFWAITVLETAAGGVCGLGALQVFIGAGTAIGSFGLMLSTVALLALFFGQRVAKDYEGAAVLATYFAVALLGIVLINVV